MFKGGKRGGGAREEERHRRSIERPGRRRGRSILVDRVVRKGMAAVPGRRRGTAAVSDTQGGGEGAQFR
jgi:hypothetical protein